MKKPDRKAFQREYGPRAAAKYVRAMQKYRKFQKNQPKPKAEPKTETKAKTPAKVTGVGPVASGAEYGRNLQKERQAKTPQPKAEVKPKPRQTTPEEAKSRFYSSSSQGSVQQNLDKAKSNFFRSSSGTRGENVKTNPALKSQPKKPSRSDFPAGRSGASAYSKAMRAYRSKQNRLKLNLPKVKRNRRGRPIK